MKTKQNKTSSASMPFSPSGVQQGENESVPVPISRSSCTAPAAGEGGHPRGLGPQPALGSVCAAPVPSGASPLLRLERDRTPCCSPHTSGASVTSFPICKENILKSQLLIY